MDIGLRKLQKKGGGSDAELVHAKEEMAIRGVKYVTMTEIVTTAATGTGTETDTAALATNDLSDPAQLC